MIMKKLLLFLVLMILTVIAKADDGGSCGVGVTWNYLSSTYTLTVRGNGPMQDYNFGNGTPPWYYLRNQIKKLIVEEGVTKIGVCAFENCSALTSFTLPNSLTNIGMFAFNECSGISSANIPNGVINIGGAAFAGCGGLTSITVDVGNRVYDSRDNCDAIIETASNTLVLGCKTTIIPNSVTSIGGHAFNGCGLLSITIPNSVTSIGSYAFYDCGNLKSITIPNSVTGIGVQAFENCSHMTSITIPNSVTNIGQSAFSGCVRLKSVTIPNSITNIESYTFSSCMSLDSVTIPNSVSTIGQSAFSGCYSLSSIYIPNSVTNIGQSAFSGCVRLKSVTIPNSVTSIEQFAFYDCEALTSVYSQIENVFSIVDYVFSENVYEDATLYIPIGTKSNYQNTAAWWLFCNIEEFEYNTDIHTQRQSKDVKIIETYQLDGKKRSTMRHGLNIVRMSDGKTKKIMHNQ